MKKVLAYLSILVGILFLLNGGLALLTLPIGVYSLSISENVARTLGRIMGTLVGGVFTLWIGAKLAVIGMEYLGKKGSIPGIIYRIANLAVLRKKNK